MKKHILWLTSIIFATLSLGCDPEDKKPIDRKPTTKKKVKAPPAKRVQVGKNIYLEVQGKRRRVFVNSVVCMRRGVLELLLTKAKTKEHEAILAADVDARKLHQALLVAGFKPGSPVQFEPKYKVASGDRIKVTLMYEKEKGKIVTVPAQQWILDKKKKPLDQQWVYGGSNLVPNPLDEKKPIFLANEGDLVCISNFESALLDLPVKISKANDELFYQCNTEAIPPMGTKVTVVFSLEKDKTK